MPSQNLHIFVEDHELCGSVIRGQDTGLFLSAFGLGETFASATSGNDILAGTTGNDLVDAGNGTGGPGYGFNDEPVSRKYLKGTLAMANAGPNTNGSQFFIVHGANAGLPPNYTIFGMVSSGVEVLDALANVEVRSGGGGERSTPVETQEIQWIDITES